MLESLTGQLDPTRILFDLQKGNEIAQSFSGCLEPEAIARLVTDGLVDQFNCAFARLWLLESDRTVLRLVASSGMYTRLDGSFGHVPMGAYKVGKIAQNRIAFLSNNLAAESWVGNREWAIANNICGFAGYPLVTKERVIGVLATFSHQAMEPEFLEVLQTLCTITTIALDTAIQYQKEKQICQSSNHPTISHLSLSDQLAGILKTARLTLVGTERPLTLPLAYIFLQTGEILNQISSVYCRLVYTDETITLEAIVLTTHLSDREPKRWLESIFNGLFFTVSYLGGVLQIQDGLNQQAMQIVLKIPLIQSRSGESIRIQCRLPILQLAFTHLAFLAGFTVCHRTDADIPLLTDDPIQIPSAKRVLWIEQGTQTPLGGIRAKVDLSISPNQFQQAVTAVMRGETWGMIRESQTPQILSERELEILTLLVQGLRDRDIAHHLMISESTVKFHINNILTKLKARTRYQAIHQAIINGWIQ